MKKKVSLIKIQNVSVIKYFLIKYLLASLENESCTCHMFGYQGGTIVIERFNTSKVHVLC